MGSIPPGERELRCSSFGWGGDGRGMTTDDKVIGLEAERH